MSAMNPAEKMLAGKRRLVKRLRNDIHEIELQAQREVQYIESRIRVAQALIEALEKGTLKP